jgi:hypothetical protein
MPDTPQNQRAYPQPDTQKPGLGFPLARIATVFSLACGAVLELAICRYAGKGQSELGTLRTLWDMFGPGDVLLADRLMCSWTENERCKWSWQKLSAIRHIVRGVGAVCRTPQALLRQVTFKNSWSSNHGALDPTAWAVKAVAPGSDFP